MTSPCGRLGGRFHQQAQLVCAPRRVFHSGKGSQCLLQPTAELMAYHVSRIFPATLVDEDSDQPVERRVGHPGERKKQVTGWNLCIDKSPAV